jgi:hypothetical protein
MIKLTDTSSNGTILNGERMTKQVPTVLNSTDIVTLAQVSPPAF